MRILLTNDDGIYAAGLTALWASLRDCAEVTVIAPDRERSAIGHAITVDQPLRADEVMLTCGSGWAVSGTPADCVKLGISCLMPERPDLIISGINRGPNLGIDVLYSGTVSGALEGIILGIPALAVSVTDFTHPDYNYAATLTGLLALRVATSELCQHTLLNINVPSLPAHEITGLKLTRLGARKYTNAFNVSHDPRGRTYYWLGGEAVDLEQEPDTDITAIKENQVSITPIRVDATDYRALDLLRDLFMDFIGEVE